MQMTLIMLPQKFCPLRHVQSPTQSPSQPSASPQAPFEAPGSARDRRSPREAVHEFQTFCRNTLYECITQEKPASLQSYLALQSLMDGLLSSQAGSVTGDTAASYFALHTLMDIPH